MKNGIIFFIALFASLGMQAQTKEEKAVAVAVDRLKTAMLNGDGPNLQKLVSDDLSYGHSSGKIEDKVSFVESLTSGKSDFVTLELSQQTIKVVNDVAIVRHNLTADTNDNGKQSSVKLFVLLVWHKENGQWKLLARQAAKNMN